MQICICRISVKIKIGDITKIRTGKLDANAADENGQYPFFTCSKEPLKINTYSYDCECVLVAGNGDLNVKYYNGKFDAYQRTYIIEDDSVGLLFMPYLYFFMESYIDELRKQSIGGVIKYIKLKNLTDALIELPSIEVQRKIVNIISKSKEIVRKKENEFELLDELVRARFVEMFGDPVINDKKWPTVSVENLCDEIYGGGTPSKAHEEYYENGDIPWVSSKDMKTDVVTDSQIKINQLGIENSTARLVPVNSVIMVIRSGILKHTLPVAINAVPITVNQDLKVFVPGNKITSRFLAAQFKMQEKSILFGVRAVTADNIEFNSLKARRMIVPPLELQNQFASFVEEVDKSRLLNICLKSLVESVLKIRIFSEYKKSS